MPKFMLRASYSIEGVKGLVKGGGSARREALKQALESVGGRLESIYFAFGADDVFLILDVPDNIGAAAVALAAAASGSLKGLQTSLLLTPEEVDQATKKSVSYRPPGQ